MGSIAYRLGTVKIELSHPPDGQLGPLLHHGPPFRCGLIEPDREEVHDGRWRRYYRLTRDGRGALADEAELRAATARLVRVRLGVAGAEVTG